MESAVEQHRVENEQFSITTTQVLNDNDRLLETVLGQEIVYVVLCHSACDSDIVNDGYKGSLHTSHECSNCPDLEAEVSSLKQKIDFMQENNLSLQVAITK